MSTRAAGWYDDPDAPGMVRWWDGAAWGDMQMPRDMARAEPTVVQRGAALATGAAKLWFLLVALVVFVALIYIAL